MKVRLWTEKIELASGARFIGLSRQICSPPQMGPLEPKQQPNWFPQEPIWLL